MISFTFPSDQDRADDEELDRVCSMLEEVLEQLSETQHLLSSGILYSYEELDRLKLVAQAELLESLASSQARPWDYTEMLILAKKLHQQAQC